MTNSTRTLHDPLLRPDGDGMPTAIAQVSPEGATALHVAPSMQVVRDALVDRMERAEWEKGVRQDTVRAVLRALYGQNGAVCHSMTGEVLDVVAEEARKAASLGVVGGQEVLWALEDAGKAAGSAFSTWLTHCKQK